MQVLSNLSCQNKKCSDYGKRRAKNLSVCGWHGINNHIRLLYCRTCKSRFSEIKNTSEYKFKPESKKKDLLLSISSEFSDYLPAIGIFPSNSE